MAKYRFNEGDIDVPDGWEDRTVTALSFPAKSQKPEASFAVTRDQSIPDGTALRGYVDKQMIDMAKTCPRFELLNRKEIDLDGNPAERLETTWRSPDGAFVQQEQTILILPSGVALVFTATAQKTKFADYAETFRNLIQTFHLRRSSSPSN